MKHYGNHRPNRALNGTSPAAGRAANLADLTTKQARIDRK